jgi:hypothetical protein
MASGGASAIDRCIGRDAVNHVMLAPPFIADTAPIDIVVERLGEAVDAALVGAA